MTKLIISNVWHGKDGENKVIITDGGREEGFKKIGLAT